MNTKLDVETVSTSRVPFHPEMTQTDEARALEFSRDYDLRRADEAATRKRSQSEMVDAAKQRMAQIFGADVAFDLRKFKRSLRHRDELRQMTDGRVDAADAAARRAKEFADYIGERGLDRTQFDLFTNDLRDIIVPLPDPFSGGKKAKPIRALPRGTIRRSFKPPFSGWQYGHDFGTLSGFRVNIKHKMNDSTGRVRNIISLEDSDATDLDAGSVHADTQMVFMYKVPRTGRIDVTINAICGRSEHSLRVYDEWGVSWSSVSQATWFQAHVVHPNAGEQPYSLLSRLDHKKDTSTNRNETPWSPGLQVHSGSLITDGAVPGGEFVEIRAGLCSIDWALTNDMQIYSKSIQSWYINQVDVKVQP